MYKNGFLLPNAMGPVSGLTHGQRSAESNRSKKCLPFATGQNRPNRDPLGLVLSSWIIWSIEMDHMVCSGQGQTNTTHL